MRALVSWSFVLAVVAAAGCGDDRPPASSNCSGAGGGGSATRPTPRGEAGEADARGGSPSAEAGAGSLGGASDGGAPLASAGAPDQMGGAGAATAGAGGAGGDVEKPPFVCDREDIALPFETWWAGYCLAKASTRTCASNFDACYAATKGFLESGLCTDDDDSNKLKDVGCAAAALAYTCDLPVSTDLTCTGAPAEPQFLDEKCRELDAALQDALTSCAPR